MRTFKWFLFLGVVVLAFLFLAGTALAQQEEVSSSPHAAYLPVMMKDYDGTDVKGGFLFAGEPPPHGMFLVGLCEVIYDDTGGRWCVYDPATSPRTYTDLEGNFEFDDVPVGEWGLVMDFALFAIMPNHPETGESIVFFFRGTRVDLGVLAYDDSWPPPIFTATADQSLGVSPGISPVIFKLK